MAQQFMKQTAASEMEIVKSLLSKEKVKNRIV